MIEEWKQLKSYEGLYEVSNLGNVKSFKRYSKGKLMTQKKDKDGYLSLGLRDKSGVRKFYRVHRLVAECFIPNPNNYEFVNHKDCDPSNNRYDNLEWCTVQHNNKYRFTHGKACNKGEKSSSNILTEKQALEIYQLAWRSDMTQPQIAKMYGVSRSAVSNIKYGNAWSHATKHNRKLEEEIKCQKS